MQLNQADRRGMPMILVIDDDETSLGLICLLLEAEGYRVMRAAGGEEAVKSAAELPAGAEPSIVLADLQMPGLCGQKLAEAMRSLLPGSRLVAMSATPSAADAYDGFLSKPLDPAALRSLILPIDGNGAEADAFPEKEAESPALDERVYRKLQRMMPAPALAEVYGTCLSDARKRAAQMAALYDREDKKLELVREWAHAIKGGAGMVGASMLAKAAARLESGSYRWEDLPVLINKLLNSCDQLQSILVTKVKPH